MRGAREEKAGRSNARAREDGRQGKKREKRRDQEKNRRGSTVTSKGQGPRTQKETSPKTQ